VVEAGERKNGRDDVASPTVDDAPGFGFTVGVAALFCIVVIVLRRRTA